MQLLTTSEVAERLRVTPQCLRNWIKQGTLQAKRFGRNFRIPLSELERLLGDPPLPAA